MLKVLLIILLFVASSMQQVFAQMPPKETDAKPGKWTDYYMSPASTAAGIDGKLQIGLTVSAEGKASGLRIYGGPMWPCGTNPADEADQVRKEVKQFLQDAVFVPATKNGKPRSSDVQITFLLSQTFRDAASAEKIEANLKKGINPPLVDVKNIQRFAISLPKQVLVTVTSPSARLSEVQVLVDENGNVISAGGFRTDISFLNEARSLACQAKFKPLVLNNQPVKMTGTLMMFLYR